MERREDGPEKNAADTIAVALNYEGGSSAPAKITASGKGEIAEQILQLAFTHGVKVRTDSDLAQILSEIEADCPIPLEAFAAVSEILSYLYKSQSKTPA
ncbi:MAG: EscU/YscU/HrcU family type III secretion system export apparatus switch protein [Sneathiella sp.]|nr:EscU/YscU/HrcU family type III secretion system export apparatus switch protein [Sneathiella sp.]